MRMYVCVLTVVVSTLVAAPCVVAQTAHSASPSTLDAAVQRHVSSTDAERALVERLLDRADVKTVAAGAGIDLRSVATAVSTMDATTLAGVASNARVLDEALAGGQSKITINTTLVIVGLLVLILLIVALD